MFIFLIQSWIEINEKFTSELKYPSSPRYKTLSLELEDILLKSIQAEIPYIVDIQIIAYRGGSIIPEYLIVVDNNAPPSSVTTTQVKSAIKSAIKNGKLGSVNLQPLFPILVLGLYLLIETNFVPL